ncbi:ead/Ea22-like family protein [Citrobacter freundii]|uniref:ead/Ea22-like family protein n=1 Tax=Citrobacter freundii TaxID=546 RepID=UPI0028C20F00|nr:ead/Ea22-like family protein [Citrobacter freundii]
MTALNKQALRGQSVEGSFYLAECGHCGEMYPSNRLNGGEPLFSGDYGECSCHLCGADDSEIADCGAWGSEGVTAWNYQQKRIEALLDELEAAEKRIAETNQRNTELTAKIEPMDRRIAELEAREIKPAKGEVLVTVSGFTGCGKSAIAGEIEIAMKAIGVPVTWSNGDAEKRMTGADWLTAIEMYKPSVRIVEVNVPHAAGIGVKWE